MRASPSVPTNGEALLSADELEFVQHLSKKRYGKVALEPAASSWWEPLTSFLRRKALEVAIGGSSDDAYTWHAQGYERPATLFDVGRCQTASGADFDLGALRGNVCVVVNVARL